MAGRRGRGWALGGGGRSWSLFPQEIAWHCQPETKGLGKKDSPRQMWEEISLSRVVLFCDFTKTTTCGSRVLYRGTALSRCQMFQLLLAVPSASHHQHIRNAVDHASKEAWAEVRLSQLKQNGKPVMSLAKLQKDEVAGACFKLVEKWLVESLSESNTNSQNCLAGFGCWCLLDPLRNRLMQ